jgi:hypothetical protein
MRSSNLLDSIVEELPSVVEFKSTNKSVNDSFFSTRASKAKKWKNVADVLE